MHTDSTRACTDPIAATESPRPRPGTPPTLQAGLAVLTLAGSLGARRPWQDAAALDLFPTFPDGHTVALWPFDESDYPFTLLCDAGPWMYDLQLMEGGALLPGRFGNAVGLGSDGGYAVAYAGLAGSVVAKHLCLPEGQPSGLWGPTETAVELLRPLASDTWTCEFWIRLAEGSRSGTILDLGLGSAPGFAISLESSSTWTVESSYSGRCFRIEGLSPGTEQWRHVAFSNREGTLTAYLDGARTGSAVRVEAPGAIPLPGDDAPADRSADEHGFGAMNPEQRHAARFNVALCQGRSGGSVLPAALDEVRVSDVARYEADFRPATFARKFRRHGETSAAEACGPPPLFATAEEGQPLPFGLRRHLFLDEALVETASGVRLRVHSPGDRRPVDFTPPSVTSKPCVVDGGETVLLYAPEGYWAARGVTNLYSSSDGLRFREHAASPVIDRRPMHGTVFRDTNPLAGPEERFKLVGWVANGGMQLFLSPDGLHWRRNETLLLPLVSGGGTETFFDDQRGEYFLSLKRDSSFNTARHPGKGRRGVLFRTDRPCRAWPFEHLEEPYFEGWTLPAVTGEGPVVFPVTETGQVYRTGMIKYAHASDAYLAFVWRYPQEDHGLDLPRHVELGVSRDGTHWSYFGSDQGWYFPTDGDEDSEQISFYGMVRRGDVLWQYTDHGGPHGALPRSYYRWSQRLDGFVSLSGRGTLVTRPIVFQGDEVELTVNSGGSVRVGLLDEDRQPVPGFALSDCEVTSDAVDDVVRWNGRSDLGSLSGRSLRLVFELADTDLYAFELRHPVR